MKLISNRKKSELRNCNFIFLIICFSFFSSHCFSQEVEPVVNNTDFRSVFDQAEEYLLNENYEKALPLYEQLLLQNQNNGNWNFKVGLCYLNSPSEYSRSVNYFERAAAAWSANSKDDSYKEDKAPLVAQLYLGDAYHRNYRFDDAIEVYKKFKTFIPEKDKVYLSYIDYKIQLCKNAQQLTADPVNMIIRNLGDSINSPYADYSPVISADESILLFTSRRPENVGGLTDANGKYFEDIYISYRTEDDMAWTKAKNVGPPINTAGHEATIGTSVDGQILFMYKDDEDSGSIYITNMQGDNWTIPEKVGGDVNSKHWESHATLSADGNTLFFVSNRPGGYGGRDIYRCKKLPTGAWSKAMNLGPNINTRYEEDSPFLQPGSSQLYFSSQGHKSMGGFDIFTSNFVDTGIMGGWTEPENIGYPVNTTGDDIFFVPTIDNKRAYYSSFAEGSYGDKDIYMLTLPEKEESKLTVLRGTVVDDFGKLPPGVMITVTDANNGDIVGNYAPNPKTGKYLFILPHGKTYTLLYEADGYHSVNNKYKVEPGKEYLSTEMVFILKEVKLEKQALGTVGVFGTVTDIQKKTVKSAKINVVDNTTGKSAGNYLSDNTGKFSFVLERGKNYNLSFDAAGYLFQSENVNMPKEQIYSSVEKNVVLQPIATGSKTILNNIFFDFTKAKLRKESFVELDKVYALLKEKTDMKVEISGHTDNKGNDKLNLKLSKDRAKAVMDYLVKKGISKSRLTSQGYGKEQPIASNDTDAGRQLNRRVELKILSK
ncbi:MAG: OmpA family protein [Bacteroidetes bacterium]|nr:OmpA family protein [Bacteroidota bacterium]